MHTFTHAYLCPIDNKPITYSGRGRRPSTCSPECARKLRAADARSRRNGTARPQRRPAAEPYAPQRYTPETYAAISVRVEAGELQDGASIGALTDEERTALVDVLDTRSPQPRASYEDMVATHATYRDIAPDVALTVGELGYSAARPSRSGGTVWASDGSIKARTASARRAAERLLAERVAEAEVEAIDEAFVYDLAPDEAARVREELLDEARRHASATIAALDGDEGAAAVARRLKAHREARRDNRVYLKRAAALV